MAAIFDDDDDAAAAVCEVECGCVQKPQSSRRRERERKADGRTDSFKRVRGGREREGEERREEERGRGEVVGASTPLCNYPTDRMEEDSIKGVGLTDPC